jgi:hypothetical protein
MHRGRRELKNKSEKISCLMKKNPKGSVPTAVNKCILDKLEVKSLGG